LYLTSSLVGYQAIALKKEYIFVAVGIAIATLAFSLSGLISWPFSLQQAPVGRDQPLQDANTTTGKIVEVPNTSIITIYDGEIEFHSTPPGQSWVNNNTSVFRSDIYDVSEYRYVSIFSEYKIPAGLTTMPNKAPDNTIPLQILLIYSDPNTGLDTTLGARTEAGGFNQVYGPKLQILVYPSAWPQTTFDDNSGPSSYVVNGNLTLSMYLTS
jgi:hypothetical protein